MMHLDSFYCSRYVNARLFYICQLFFGTFDIRAHTDKGIKKLSFLVSWYLLITDCLHRGRRLHEVSERTQQVASLVKSANFTAGAAGFNHLAGGYDAGTYMHRFIQEDLSYTH